MSVNQTRIPWRCPESVNELYTSDGHENWLYNKYYAAGSNSRYFTFQLVLNILSQRKSNEPINIVETGCQRQKDDLGAGMSTSIFTEWASLHNGHVTSVDNNLDHLKICAECIEVDMKYINLVYSDSVKFLSEYKNHIDLLYLDSYDYPILDNAEDESMRNASQQHCLNEFKAIEDRLNPNTILMIDDNTLPYGGKPKLLKEYLVSKGWILLLDYQQSVWVRNL